MSAYDQEHIDLVTAIRTNQPINEAENTAKSTLMAILGRASAYTGAEITWDEIFSIFASPGANGVFNGRLQACCNTTGRGQR